MTTVLLPWEKMKSERKFLRFSTSATVSDLLMTCILRMTPRLKGVGSVCARPSVEPNCMMWVIKTIITPSSSFED